MRQLSIPLFYIFLLGIPSTLTCVESTNKAPFSKKIDFFKSMNWGKKGNHQINEKLPRLKLLKALYDRNDASQKAVQGKAVIPKIVHQIWVGPKTPPAIFQKSLESIHKYLPGWEYKLWTDADIPSLKLYNQKFYDLSKNYGEKADILRYEILYRYGGIYLDVDFVCLKPFDDLLQYDLWTSIYPPDSNADIGNSIIGTIPEHPLLWDCVVTLKDDWYSFNTGHLLDVVYKAGPVHFQKSFMKFINDNTTNIIAFPASYFYPVDFKSRPSKSKNSAKKREDKITSMIKPESYAIHYWAGSWWNAKVKNK
ncbi:hypothetical protein H0X06_01115 [Candidatus Dependentiae bacterium]|nr:hypothetical protein [Candidatus Dependentiae bacterium]